jgi:hypothetical protein
LFNIILAFGVFCASIQILRFVRNIKLFMKAFLSISIRILSCIHRKYLPQKTQCFLQSSQRPREMEGPEKNDTGEIYAPRDRF